MKRIELINNNNGKLQIINEQLEYKLAQMEKNYQLKLDQMKKDLQQSTTTLEVEPQIKQLDPEKKKEYIEKVSKLNTELQVSKDE